MKDKKVKITYTKNSKAIGEETFFSKIEYDKYQTELKKIEQQNLMKLLFGKL